MNWVEVSFFSDFASVVHGYWYDRPWRLYGPFWSGAMISESIPEVPWQLATRMGARGWAYVKPEDTNPGECWSEDVFSEIDVNTL